MKTVKLKSYAKINLTLEILGIEGGYHLLDSLVASVDLYDIILLKKRNDQLSHVTMKGMGSEGIPPYRDGCSANGETAGEGPRGGRDGDGIPGGGAGRSRGRSTDPAGTHGKAGETGQDHDPGQPAEDFWDGDDAEFHAGGEHRV